MMYDELIEQLRETSIDFGESDHVSVMLIEAADAIEELQKAVNFNKFNSEFWKDKYNSLADGKWIPVTERLPEERADGFSDDVLMLIENPDGDKIWRDVYVGYYLYDAVSDETGWWVKMTCDCTKVGEHKHGGKIYKADEYVTHWMPLPEPPESEGE